MIIGLFIRQHGLLRGLLTHDFLNSFSGLIGEHIVFRYFLIFHQVVHKVGEIKLVKINPWSSATVMPRQSGLLAPPKPICS
jgi:hypothetical protein